MKNGFIKNPKLLEEDYRIDDLLDFSSVVIDFEKTLENINNNAVVGLIGKFGSGKSTMLYQLYKGQNNNSDKKWIVFDAWRYPERKELWEGFVLDIASQLDKKLFEEARKNIDGTKSGSIKSLMNVLFEGVNIFIPGASIGKNFTSLLKSSPAKRVFEFQEILKEVIENEKKNIFIIIEDIDRSGDRGIFFLETLRNFIKENKFDKKIIVIVPIGDNFFEENKISYLKTVDYRINFKPTKIGYKKFIENIFADDFMNNNLFIYHLDYLFKILSQEKQFTIREIKHILRLANLNFQKLSTEEQSRFDVRILILFEVINYTGDKIINLVNETKRIKNDFWGMKYLLMIANKVTEENFKKQSFKMDLPFFLAGEKYVPFFDQNTFYDEEVGYCMTNKYANLYE